MVLFCNQCQHVVVGWLIEGKIRYLHCMSFDLTVICFLSCQYQGDWRMAQQLGVTSKYYRIAEGTDVLSALLLCFQV